MRAFSRAFGLLDSDAGQGVGRRAMLGWLGAAALARALGGEAGAQMAPGAADASAPGNRRPGDEGAEMDALHGRMQRSLSEQRNDERQKELEADTKKLLELARNLEADVSKSNKNELSLEVIKRAEQIEKLARSVREKMRGYY
jgi:hypothetical protein